MINQATINIGTIGHVAHGKSVLVRAITGTNTVKSKKEKERNITINLGYANAKIYKCPKCPDPQCYQSFGSGVFGDVVCAHCATPTMMKLVRHVSFVDCPGHNAYMTTMLSGTSVMDAGLLLVAANESCPQPQTIEHLMGVEIMGLKNIIIIQNKIDLVKRKDALLQKEQINKVISNTIANGSPIIPISATFKYNVDRVLSYIVNKIPLPIRQLDSPPRLTIIRSFDINKAGIKGNKLRGGVVGGTLTQGILRLGDTIEILPGIKTDTTYTPIQAKVISLYTEKNKLETASPGGLIAIGLTIDPSLTIANGLVGQVLGLIDTLPGIFNFLELSYTLLPKLLGVDNKKISPLELGEKLIINIGSMTTMCEVHAIKKNLLAINLSNPVCLDVGEKVTLSRNVREQWCLIGHGRVLFRKN